MPNEGRIFSMDYLYQAIAGPISLLATGAILVPIESSKVTE
jgi:hypothetical protein